ncbi:MAG: hypothetical protein KDN20_05535 [Verrucomicrobiae bacterium]|nr:hypothetical protein [Verrucomicrobiae bacterium]
MSPKVGFIEPPSLHPNQKLAPLVVRLLILQAVIGVAATAMLVWELGWPFTTGHARFAEWFTWGLVLLALVVEAGLAWRDRSQSTLKRFFILGALIVLALGRSGLERPLRDWLGEHLATRSAALIALVVVQVSLVVPFGLRLLGMTRSRFLQKAKPGVLFVGSFAAAIVVGTLMLKTPQATTEGITWLDALFTSTSAICVTGLIVVDTETAFTSQGQVVILLMIQAGGLGIMTLTYFMSLIVGQGITLRDSAKLRELFSEDNVGAMGHFVARIVVVTLLIEALGAFFIHWSWASQPARPGREVFDAIFHSASAFCNAGFSTFSDGLADPIIAKNRSLQVTIMMLIIVGGIGFAVLHDLPPLLARGIAKLLRIPFRRSRRLSQIYLQQSVRLHTPLALRTTAILLLGGAVVFFLAADWNLSGDHLWEAVFNSVTARTAGFNIADFGSYSFAAVVLMCFLMFIGGSPGGTAGGVKTTTFAVAVGELGRLIRGHQSLQIRNRRIPKPIVERCTATIVLSLLWVALSILLLSWSNPELDPSDIIFECFSAFGTAGLSRGITADLDTFSKLVIILSMFAGRVGLLTLVLTIAGASVPRRYELPDGNLPLN